MTALDAFSCVRPVGAVLPADALARAAEGRMPGQATPDYQLTPGMAINAAVARAWEACLGAHRAWTTALQRLPDTDPAEALTRAKWLLPLLYELGWGRPETLRAGLHTPPGLGDTEPGHFPISHQLTWPDHAGEPDVGVPVHLLGARTPLDVASPGVTKRAPQSMLQDFLNRHPRYLWGVLSNGVQLRILRDGSSLARQAYVEFDLEDIFTNQRYAEFRLLFLTAHASRFTPTTPTTPTDDEEPASLAAHTCWLERWRTDAIDNGARALTTLRLAVARAIEHLGTGFVAHPANTDLRAHLAAAPDAATDLHRALLRIAYRLVVLFVAEDRHLLHTACTDPAAHTRYTDYFSTTRLRRLATTRTGSRHTDLWDAHLIVTDALAGEGLPTLGLPGLAASLFDRDTLGLLRDAELPNRAFLAAVAELAHMIDPATGVPRPVDYRHLDSEELGGIYEGLLAYLPRYDATTRTLTLQEAAGNDRKTSGSYYTPTALIELVLDEALDPLITEACATRDPETAVLALTVLDPACGSGHFIVAAARRIAAALATVRAGTDEPAPDILRTATADVIGRCVYGVDLNDLAIEITKVALWLEAFDGTRPLPFLDAHFKVGNALLGTTPKLLADNIPDTAFTVLTGDTGEWTKKLKARNKAERLRDTTQLALDTDTLAVDTSELAKKARAIDEQPAHTLTQARERADAWRRLDTDPVLASRRLVADAWCAAFVQPKTDQAGPGITYDTLRRLADNPDNVPMRVPAMVRELARRHRFFHWHLEFPTIFTATEHADDDANLETGWQGGFSCVLGNPPWETVQMSDKEFFTAHGRDDIAHAKTAALRGRMIKSLPERDPALADAYAAACGESDAVTNLLRSGRFPLTATGKINTYSVFAETFRTLLAPTGAAGIITPTGLATDKTTATFFSDTIKSNRLLAFYDFENEAKIFEDVNNRPRFSVSAMSGFAREATRTRYAFVVRHVVDVPNLRFELAPAEVLTMNPNTGTLPMFRTRADADITLGIYRRHPVLIRDAGDNPWQLTFKQGLFNMASDSGLFHQPEDLTDARFDGWSYKRGEHEFLPLYEAKMLGHFDHRFSTYRDATQAQLNKGTLPRPGASEHDDPDMEPLARHWVARTTVTGELDDRWDRDWLLGWRDIARSSDMRTFVPSVFPTSAVGHKFPLAFPSDATCGPLLHAVWSSLVFDYVARQKLSGTGMPYFIVKQLACPTRETFSKPTLWLSDRSLAEWVVPYVLELSHTSWRTQPYAREMHDDGPPFHWDPARRALLRADLDAAFLHVYGLTRSEVEHVLDSFFVVRKYEERDHGEYRTRRLVLDAYDRMAAAVSRGGQGWAPLADIPAGQGPRHARHEPAGVD